MAKRYYTKEYDLEMKEKKIHITKYILPSEIEGAIELYKLLIQEREDHIAKKMIVIRNKVNNSLEMYLVGKESYKPVKDEKIKELIESL